MSAVISAANDVRFLILGLQRKGNNYLTQALSGADISPSQAEVIQILARNGQMCLRDLGRELVCEIGDNPSRLVERLVSKGLVSKDRSPRDGRALLLDLTQGGVRVHEEVIIPVESAFVSMISEGVSGSELSELHRLLRKLAAQVS